MTGWRPRIRLTLLYGEAQLALVIYTVIGMGLLAFSVSCMLAGLAVLFRNPLIAVAGFCGVMVTQWLEEEFSAPVERLRAWRDEAGGELWRLKNPDKQES